MVMDERGKTVLLDPASRDSKKYKGMIAGNNVKSDDFDRYRENPSRELIRLLGRNHSYATYVNYSKENRVTVLSESEWGKVKRKFYPIDDIDLEFSWLSDEEKEELRQRRDGKKGSKKFREQQKGKQEKKAINRRETTKLLSSVLLKGGILILWTEAEKEMRRLLGDDNYQISKGTFAKLMEEIYPGYAKHEERKKLVGSTWARNWHREVNGNGCLQRQADRNASANHSQIRAGSEAGED